MPARPSSPFARALYHTWLWLFTVLVIMIFIMAWLVQANVIVMPRWAVDWSDASPDVRAEYAAALLTCVCVLFLLFSAAVVVQMRREGTRNG
ncbi:hypothetical protein QBC46DRAFT_274395 [Diplogelasinospora grovesii]|uniref:Uncharacterized protein n=1 Tax=Diplogelasinospora grovesii TaxID=303347 RepID=A0AAN6MWH6_9PEZI|nr:hypothetical protein QBC46DRAFT_274395 [Diplogelasinospora grovesii]